MIDGVSIKWVAGAMGFAAIVWTSVVVFARTEPEPQMLPSTLVDDSVAEPRQATGS